MSEHKDKMNEISASLMKLFVADVFSRHNITDSEKRKLSKEQKDQIKEIVADLKDKVEDFLENQKTKKITEETFEPETPQNVTLRELLKKNKKKDD
ncbi:hypothetical protein GJU40_07010 [Bacillus lacus]|uniref:Spore coat protein n=1 Tax=Metabacillus lacus TaxID=1983721 RepID=A0A7X2IYA9_9BACI|nr:hypothetical protein [Metabacillus lacus]MRX71921.1 hypothetical protein [Metabacillus lacus]